MYLRQPAADRINIDPGIEIIPSLSKGSIMRGDSPAKSANIFSTDVSVLLANRTGSSSTSRKQVNLHLEGQRGMLLNFAGKRSTLCRFQVLARSGHNNDTPRLLVPASYQAIQRGRVKRMKSDFLLRACVPDQ